MVFCCSSTFLSPLGGGGGGGGGVLTSWSRRGWLRTIVDSYSFVHLPFVLFLFIVASFVTR